MGLANYFGWDGVDTWANGNRNMLMGVSADLLSGNPGGGRAMQGRAADDANAVRAKEAAQRMAQIQSTTEYLRSSGQDQLASLIEGTGDIGQATNIYNAVKPPASAQNNIANDAAARQKLADQYGLEGRERLDFILTSKLPGGNQSVRAGLGQPIVLVNKTTQERKPFMPMSDGTYIDPLTQTPADDQWAFDPAYVAAQRAQGTKVGGLTGETQFNLPQAELMAEQTLNVIADLRKNETGMDEQFGNFLGIPQQMTPAYPGSPKANFQVQTGRLTNRAFLEARQMLRGGGQITDFESRKAEGAITEIEDAMARGDKELFKRALKTFEDAVKDGLEKLKQQAGGMDTVGAMPGGAGDGWTVIGVE